jgi:hypothetical protein
MDDDETPEVEKPARRTRAAKPEADGDICAECWPEGWLGQANAAVCDHGSFKR